jgi:serine/threonine-protein kinase
MMEAKISDDSIVGTKIEDKYVIKKKLAEGGMGAVYLADHTVLERKFALKILAPELARQPKLVARFLQEARSASRIGNEHVIEIYDFGQTDDGLVFIAMEFLDGKNLGEVLQTEGAMKWSRAQPIIAQISQALRAAHGKNIIHRDMTPANIILIAREDQDDYVKVLDFGIAKVIGLGPNEAQLTQTGELLGTPAYMSPEQAEGKDADHRADIYAVGCIVYHMLTGEKPFLADSLVDMLNKHRTEAPVPPSKRRSGLAITPEMDSLVLTALEKDRENRWQSMTEFLDAMEGCLGASNSRRRAYKREHDLPIGEVLADRYEIIRKLGEGAMGTVYLAKHQTLDKLFALKVLAPELAKREDLVARFLREARSAASIDHENVVGIFDFVQVSDRLVFFVMEYLAGEDLGSRLDRDGAMAWRQAQPIAVQICRALVAAHAKGIVHRDMKPENILVIPRTGQSPLVKLLDFGVAKVTGNEDFSLTRTGMVFGTPGYMAPEQAQGGKIDHRADVFAVGCVLYHMLTGEMPFKPESYMAMLFKSHFVPPAPPSRRRRDGSISAEIDDVVLEALEQIPGERWPSMAAFLDAVEGCSEPAASPPESQAQVPTVLLSRWRWRTTNALLVAMAGLAAILIFLAVRRSSMDVSVAKQTGHVAGVVTPRSNPMPAEAVVPVQLPIAGVSAPVPSAVSVAPLVPAVASATSNDPPPAAKTTITPPSNSTQRKNQRRQKWNEPLP